MYDQYCKMLIGHPYMLARIISYFVEEAKYLSLDEIKKLIKGVRIGDKIGKAVTQRSPNDDIGRVAAHGGGATQVRTENFRQHHRHRVKFQQLRKLDRYRR